MTLKTYRRMTLPHPDAQTPWTDATARRMLRDLFDAAIASANPLSVLAAHLPKKPRGRCIVVGAGKASAAMAVAVEAAWGGVAISGAVAVPYGYALPTARITVIEAAHPVPDANSESAAQAMIASLDGLTPDDLVLALISGGGSSVLSLAAPGLTLADKQVVNRVLLASGLDIRTMNAVRKRLSAIKGGKLGAMAAPARLVTLGISDIPGDDPGAIASGPTVVGRDDAMDLGPVIERIGHALPPAVVEHLQRQPDPVRLPEDHEFRMIATPAAALDAAAACARAAGLDVVMLGDDLEGEAAGLGRKMARLACRPCARPTVFLSGGETTVTLGEGATGRGGRNTEFVMAMARELNGAAGIWAMAGDTDGEDGSGGGIAGAIIAPDTVARAHAHGIDIDATLSAHDSGSFFETLGDVVRTGPTLTNVNDFRAILVIPPT
jgi:hydroxypyruvate reductase